MTFVQVEKLLGEAEGGGNVESMSATDLYAHAGLLNRLAAEVSRLDFHAARGQVRCPFLIPSILYKARKV